MCPVLHWRWFTFYDLIGFYPALLPDHCISSYHSTHHDVAERADITVMIDQDTKIDD